MPAHAQRMSSLLALDRECVFCRVAKGAYTKPGEVRKGFWRGAAQAACTRMARLKAGGRRARAERTLNILAIFVTLDVSLKVSRWLNADAPCRVKGRADDAGRAAGRKAGGRVRQQRRERRASAWA